MRDHRRGQVGRSRDPHDRRADHPSRGGDAEASAELPAAVSRTLKLDGERHWLKLDELNRFAWPATT
ncbi:hypothetical protein [Phenylobacterium sp.]|jgi:hypothetical protein|uniref:hypothetical protein n=1 Tax=Phenylobacterium sp. TaxID=1871053 RepID=UPI002F411086